MLEPARAPLAHRRCCSHCDLARRRVWDRHALLWHRPQLPRCEDDPARPPPRHLRHGHGTRRSLPAVWRGRAAGRNFLASAACAATHRTRGPPACSGFSLRAREERPRCLDAEARLLYGLRPCACPTSPLSLFGPPGDVHVLQWDPSTEMLVLSAAADAEQAAAAVRRGELDSSLGPYPLKTHDEWVGLSRHLDEAVIRRAGLQCGTFVLAGGIDDDEGLGAAGGAEAVTPFFEGLPRTARWVQTDPRKVWASDRRLGGAGLQGEQLSRFFQVRPHPHAHSVHTHGHNLSHTRGCRLVAAWVHGVRAFAPLPGLGSHMHLPCIFHASPMHLPCISHASPMLLPCISHASPMHLPGPVRVARAAAARGVRRRRRGGGSATRRAAAVL